MSVQIHPTAIVNEGAQLGNNVRIGPYAIISDNVKIGDSSVIEPFVNIGEYSEIGRECRIFNGAVIGSISQDLKYKNTKSFLVIGDNNTIREFVTINRGTEEDSKTVIGNSNHIMAYSHIAHDCTIGDENIFANCATLAGYVEVGSKSVIGGLTAVHQFCRIGSFAIVGGCSKVVQDIPPYSMCDGHPAGVRGLNLIGLRRAEFDQNVIRCLKKAFKILFFENHPFDKARDLVQKDVTLLKEIDCLLRFISSSKRGVAAK